MGRSAVACAVALFTSAACAATNVVTNAVTSATMLRHVPTSITLSNFVNVAAGAPTNKLLWASVNDVVNGSLDKPLPRYLGYMRFDSTYPEDAEWYYSLADYGDGGGCSVRRLGNLVERNYDWYFDGTKEYVVEMLPGPGRFGSIGIGNAGTNVSADVVVGGEGSRFYRCLPGHMLDGINDCGVVAEINVSSGESGWPTNGEVHCLGAVRWALDHGETARQAAKDLAARVYVPAGFGMNFHYMLADEDETWIVENGVAHKVASEPAVMTNFCMYPDDPEGSGWERYAILTNAENSITNAWWTKAYESNSVPVRVSDIGTNETVQAAIFGYWPSVPREAHRGEVVYGQRWWQTVHTAVYSIRERSFRVTVQESGDWYEFSLPHNGRTDRHRNDKTVYEPRKDHWTWAPTGGPVPEDWLFDANCYTAPRPVLDPTVDRWFVPAPVGGLTATNEVDGTSFDLSLVFRFDNGMTATVSRASATSEEPVPVHRGETFVDTATLRDHVRDFTEATNLIDRVKRDKDDYRVYRKAKDCWAWTSNPVEDAPEEAPADFLAYANSPSTAPLYCRYGSWFGAAQFWPDGKLKYGPSTIPPSGGELRTNIIWKMTAYDRTGTNELYRFGALARRENPTNETLVSWSDRPVNEFVRLATTDVVRNWVDELAAEVTNTIETYRYRVDTSRDWFNLRAFEVSAPTVPVSFSAWRTEEDGKHFRGRVSSHAGFVEADISYGFVDDAPKFVLSATGRVDGVTYFVHERTEVWGTEESHTYSNALVEVSADGTVTNLHDVTLSFVRDEIARKSDLDAIPPHVTYPDATNLVRSVPIPQRRVDPGQVNFGIWAFGVESSVYPGHPVPCEWAKTNWTGAVSALGGLEFSVTGVNTNGTYEFEMDELTNGLHYAWTGLDAFVTNLTHLGLGVITVKPVLESPVVGEDEVRALVAAHTPDVKVDFTEANAVLVSTIERISSGYAFVYHGYGEFTLVMADGTITVAEPHKIYRHVVSFSWNAPDRASFFTLDGTHNLVRSPDGYAVKDFTEIPDGYQLYSTLSNGVRPLTGVLTCPVSITVEE